MRARLESIRAKSPNRHTPPTRCPCGDLELENHLRSRFLRLGLRRCSILIGGIRAAQGGVRVQPNLLKRALRFIEYLMKTGA